MNVAEKFGLKPYEFRLIFGETKIEYDENKEEINRKKHGYSLESAVHFFERLLLPFLPNKPFMTEKSLEVNGEIRHIHMGVGDSDEIILFVTTMRNNETVRIISMRRAYSHECQTFNEHFGL